METAELSATMKVLAWRGKSQPITPFAKIAEEQWAASHSSHERTTEKAIHIDVDGIRIVVPDGADVKLVEHILQIMRAGAIRTALMAG